MSPAFIPLLAFMTCTFALGLFLGWALWRYGGVSRAAMDDLQSKIEFLKKSLDQSRLEVWKLQEEQEPQSERKVSQSRRISRRRTVEKTISRNPLASDPAESA